MHNLTNFLFKMADRTGIRSETERNKRQETMEDNVCLHPEGTLHIEEEYHGTFKYSASMLNISPVKIYIYSKDLGIG